MLETLRGAVRPVTLLLAVSATIFYIILGIPVPESWWTLVGIYSTYFFVSRQQAK